MKKYLLVVFGDFKDTKVLAKIAKGMTPIVDSPHLKLHQNVSSVIFHFASEVQQEDLQDFFVGLFYGVSDYFILTEMTDKVSVSMNDDLKAHLLDLENDTDFVESVYKDEFHLSEEDLINSTNTFVDFLLDEFHTEVKKPTLNQILDKISEKGIKSLTAFEKEILDNYSKN